jgi:hypothetical protein
MRAESDLEAIYRLFTWRITSNYVPHWDFEQMKAEIGDWDEWCRVWSSYAARHAALGKGALTDGDGRAAGAHYVRAGLFYHWASFLFRARTPPRRSSSTSASTSWSAGLPRSRLTAPATGR